MGLNGSDSVIMINDAWFRVMQTSTAHTLSRETIAQSRSSSVSRHRPQRDHENMVLYSDLSSTILKKKKDKLVKKSGGDTSTIILNTAYAGRFNFAIKLRRKTSDCLC